MLKRYSLPMLASFIISTGVIASPHCKFNFNQNTINYKTTSEAVIAVDRAQVSVRLNATLNPSKAGNVQQNAINKLQKITPKSKWVVLNYNQNKTNSGLLNISMTFKTHLNSVQVAKLTSLMESLNNTGENFSISGVDYVPELENIEQTKSQLRIKIFGEIKRQVQQMNQSENTHYRLKDVIFSSQSQGAHRNAPRVMSYMVKADNDSTANNALRVSQKIIMTADVELAENNKK